MSRRTKKEIARAENRGGLIMMVFVFLAGCVLLWEWDFYCMSPPAEDVDERFYEPAPMPDHWWMPPAGLLSIGALVAHLATKRMLERAG